jgi:tRNA A37 methylthiotransferase MiaB
MAEASTPKNPVPHEGDHDRVQMLSLRADGTPDQHNPEIVGDRDAVLAATKEQFKQQAVSAADAANAPAGGGTTVEDAPQDPAIEAAQKEHEKVAAAAEKAAEKAVDALSK